MSNPSPASASASVAEAPLDAVYRALSGDDADERACAALSEQACTDLPRNYLLNVANGTATKLAEQLASPGTVLPWLLAAAGAPAVFAGLLVPVKTAGSLLPQLAVAGWVRGRARRKWVWALAGSAQALLLALLSLAALVLPPVAAGAAVVACFTAFSLASGVGSVAFQDVTGKTVPKGRRGRLLSHRALFGGLLTLGLALAFRLWGGDRAPLGLSVVLVLAAAVLWALGAGCFAAVEEQPGHTQGGRSMLGELQAGLSLLGSDAAYRRFLAARCLLLAVELSPPFFSLLAARAFGVSGSSLALLVLAAGFAEVVANPLWGRLADAASQRVMAGAGLLSAVAGVLAWGMATWPSPVSSGAELSEAASMGNMGGTWLQSAHPVLAGTLLALLFALATTAQAGLRLGRKTWLVDHAPEAERPLYTAFANTAAGVLALTGGLAGVAAQFWGTGTALGLLAALALAGAGLAWRLPRPGEST